MLKTTPPKKRTAPGKLSFHTITWLATPARRTSGSWRPQKGHCKSSSISLRGSKPLDRKGAILQKISNCWITMCNLNPSCVTYTSYWISIDWILVRFKFLKRFMKVTWIILFVESLLSNVTCQTPSVHLWRRNSPKLSARTVWSCLKLMTCTLTPT